MSVFHLPPYLFSHFLLLILFSMNIVVPSYAKSKINQNPLFVQATLKPNRLAPGENAQLILNLSLAKHYKAYKDQFKLEALSPTGVKLGTLSLSPEVEFLDTHSKRKRTGVENKAQLSTVIELAQDTPVGEQELKLKLTFQACTKKICLLPKSLIVKTRFDALTPEDRFSAQPTPLPKRVTTSPSIKKYLQKGLLFTFVFIFFAGVLTSFTPCIFPMIPITLAILGAKQDGEHKRLRGFALSVSYVLGIATTYSILGLMAASTGSVFGSLLGHPIAVTIIAVIFTLMGLSMYGFFELQVPTAISNKLINVKTQKSSHSGAFASGIIAGIVASPCVGPVLVGILTYVSQTQNLVLGFLFLFTFALGLGQIFIVLGTFSSLTKKIPRSGPWMEVTKFIFGTTMLAMAIYYLEPVIPERLLSAIMALFLIFIATLFGAFRPADPNKLITQFLKAFFLVVFCFGLAFAFKSIFWKEWMALQQGGTSAPQKQKAFWTPYSDKALKEAQAKGQPVVIDFYADWCAACKDLENKTFSDPQVRLAAKGFLWLKFDATNDSKELTQLQEKYGIQGLPTIILYDSKGQYRTDLTLTGFEDGEHFIKRIQKL